MKNVDYVTKKTVDEEGKKVTYKVRENKNTGKNEYKVRYYFMTSEGKKDCETPWFDSLEKAMANRKREKADKEREDRAKVRGRKDAKFITVFEQYTEYLRNEYEKDKSTTNTNYYYGAKILCDKYMLKEITEIRIKDIDTTILKRWVSYINKQDISGATVSNYKGSITRFSKWLVDFGYIDGEIGDKIAYSLSKTRTKSKKIGNKERKGKRYLIKVEDIFKIGKYYKDDIGKFRNFYYYTMFYVLFFSGMRFEELRALQWKFVTLKDEYHKIEIVNAISSIEGKDRAIKRVQEKDYKTKNDTSNRIISIWEFYYHLLIDYKESYKYQYGLSDEEMKEAFVFPTLLKKNPFDYASSHAVLDELKKVSEEVGIPKTDLQMFRHACAMFLILKPPKGLGFDAKTVYSYFGHSDEKMLNQIYARLNKEELNDKQDMYFSELYRPIKNESENHKEEFRYSVIDLIKGEVEIKNNARDERIYKQIIECEKKKQKYYYYKKEDKAIIDEYVRKRNSGEIKIVYRDKTYLLEIEFIEG